MKTHPSATSSSVHGQTDPHASDIRDERRAFAQAVRFYLQADPRQLPSRFLYDALGSALFDAICHLPWYRITRAELQLLQRQASTIGHVMRPGARVVELGCGNGEKLATLLTHADVPAVHAHLIDLSDAALTRSVQTLATIEDVSIHVTTHRATYEDGLLALPTEERHPTLVAFLGSNIGNFDPPGAAAFVALIRAALQPHDYLLLGADLVKPERELLLAYDDPLGLTAAFNKNLLLRLNTELGADFDLNRFAHRAVWNPEAARVEMHLVSLAPQEVHVTECQLSIRLETGETIWTESSYKYEPAGIRQLVEPAGFVQRHQWIDAEGRMALTLFEAVGGGRMAQEAPHAFIERVHGVRYQVKDVARAVAFYTQHLGFKLEHQQLPAFANVSLGESQILLSGPGASGSRPMPGGQQQEPGGWNRVVLKVADLPAFIAELKKAGVRFRNEMETGPGGRQIQIADPDGNPIELFEPAR